MKKIFLTVLMALMILPASLNALEGQPMIGEQAPDFSLKDLDGNTVILSGLKNNIVVMHFAASWCPYCNAEAPHLEALYQKYKDKNVKVLIVNCMEKPDIAKAWAIDRHKFSFPILLDSYGKVTAKYAPQGVMPDLPRHEVPIASNLIIDKEGKIIFYSLLDSKNFDAKLTEINKQLEQMMAKK
ncbi:MAG: TlpA family protein disulfide reductase [Candidatus Dadabacteria bacterium]|nr:TlpA family protein disulfide reductase [Candidatus Dadabacteria bacterium]NIS09235.1 TlpA family protein disulfide reductase [Candidatus Dadabacteria bacterium]NIV41883.1 redoxin domain-containing protein [Candidatus Dadabacteria bacterium]NIX15781.1 redoxin domain-containing protein [Candidatus Dadabacteria bacterium]NIY22511.1 redoxin domain-containing protein [Candidatus Dadabacteria bacterium]